MNVATAHTTHLGEESVHPVADHIIPMSETSEKASSIDALRFVAYSGSRCNDSLSLVIRLHVSSLGP
jgi:hypothetical protein